MLMLTIMRTSLLLLVAVIGGGAYAPPVSAANEWHTNGPKTFSTTNAGASRWVIHSATGVVLVGCETSSLSGTLNGPTSPSLPWTNAGTLRPAFGSCRVSGTAGYLMSCGSGTLRAQSYSGGTTLATAGGGHSIVTATVHCELSFGATVCSTLHETWPLTVENPNPIISNALKVIKFLAPIVIPPLLNRILKKGSGCAAVPDGTTTFGAPDAGSNVLNLTYTVDGPTAPYLYYGT
jgi:hypothetical protein